MRGLGEEKLFEQGHRQTLWSVVSEGGSADVIIAKREHCRTTSRVSAMAMLSRRASPRCAQLSQNAQNLLAERGLKVQDLQLLRVPPHATAMVAPAVAATSASGASAPRRRTPRAQAQEPRKRQKLQQHEKPHCDVAGREANNGLEASADGTRAQRPP